MDDDTIFWIAVGIFAFGATALLALIVFGTILFRDWALDNYGYLVRLLNEINDPAGRVPPPHVIQNAAQTFADTAADFRERRNEFWTTYGQVALSIFIVTVLSVLLLTKTIEPDAGLPILSGIAGFAIAKTASAGKPRGSVEPTRSVE